MESNCFDYEGYWYVAKKKKAKNLVKNKITCSKKRRVVKSDTRS